MEKKAYMKPELIILVRSKPEEAVLNTCKGQGNPPGPSAVYVACMSPHGSCANCIEVGYS